MTPEEAVEYALSQEEQVPPPTSASKEPPSGRPQSVLTRREEEVAVLVARGLTNRQIAAELALSERPVENHVLRRILKKLGFRSRARIAAWVAEQPVLSDPE